MIKVLVIDDEETIRKILKKELSRKGFYTETASDGEEGIELLRTDSFDVVLLDIVMPGMDGLEVLKKMSGEPSSPVFIVLTGKATVENAVLAMKHGAFDYVTKPYKLDELSLLIEKAYEYRSLRIKSEAFKQELVKRETTELVFRSKQMEDIYNLIKKIAPTDSPVLIEGETGTGKEVIARAIWHYSKRSNAPFLALNCAALTESLMEAELFGYEKGAFTNAYRTKYGIVEVADKGTLFLDEIGEMPLSLQAKLLRFLDSGEFRRVGSNKASHADVRIIAATNRDLMDLISKGQFRHDLYYRLNVINIKLPPLRERKEDIPLLAEHFIKKYRTKFSKPIEGFSPEAIELLMSYEWPGNVRELENIIERAVILCDKERIEREDIAIKIPNQLSSLPNQELLNLEELERAHILKILQETGWNQSKASQLLGIDRKTLYLKLKKYNISAP